MPWPHGIQCFTLLRMYNIERLRELFLFSIFLILPTTAFAKLDIDGRYPSGIWHTNYSIEVAEDLKEDPKQTLMKLPGSLVADICTRYDKLKAGDRKNFWQTFFMALAYAESGFDHNSGPMTGIMQLTCDENARKRYGCSACTSADRLRKAPLIGIDCAVKIVSQWAAKGKLLTNHPYFETLRKNAHYYNKVKPTVLAYAPKACENAPRAPKRSDDPADPSKIQNRTPHTMSYTHWM